VSLTDCGTLPTIDNGAYVLVDSSNTTYGAPASVHCNTGYNSSIDVITCTENGTWSDAQCLAVGKCVLLNDWCIMGTYYQYIF